MIRTLKSAARPIIRPIRVFWKTIPGWVRFWWSLREYRRIAPTSQKPRLAYLYPCIGDDTQQTDVDPTYVYQDAWAFEAIVKSASAWHVDVGSHHKYVSLLAKVVPVTMVDIRPLPVTITGLTFVEGTILNLPFETGSVPSVSSLCVVEHIGLGRYGDPLDPDGSEKAVRELKRIVKPGGSLYISVPLDDENRVYFNAHRAFQESYLLELFAPFELVERRYIYDYDFLDAKRPGFGTGCYHLRKPQGEGSIQPAVKQRSSKPE